MSNLTEIAKENGAYINEHEKVCGSVFPSEIKFTPAQLQATVEQVCKPLIKALEDFDADSFIQDVGAADFCATTCEAKEGAQLALSYIRQLMGKE